MNSFEQHWRWESRPQLWIVPSGTMKEREPVLFVRLPEVRRATGLSKSSLYLRINAGEFPAPVKLGGQAVGCLATGVDQWVIDRLAGSRTTHPPTKGAQIEVNHPTDPMLRKG